MGKRNTQVVIIVVMDSYKFPLFMWLNVLCFEPDIQPQWYKQAFKEKYGNVWIYKDKNKGALYRDGKSTDILHLILFIQYSVQTLLLKILQ